MSRLSTLSTSNLLNLAKATIIQPLLPHLHKGQAGRVLVMGGSEDYAGAPYFLALALMQMGCDLTHVVCDTTAGGTIKAYSPDLMVHPYLQGGFTPFDLETDLQAFLASPPSAVDQRITTQIQPRINAILSRSIHSAVIGPGLGRDPLILATAQATLGALLEARTPVVLDADALYLVSLRPELLTSRLSKDTNPQVVLTPNILEFRRLCVAVGVSPDLTRMTDEAYLLLLAQSVSQRLGNVAILLKGQTDLFACGEVFLAMDHSHSVTASLRRCGGQGDTLTGILATLLAWHANYQQGKLWNTQAGETDVERMTGSPKLSPREGVMLCCWVATLVLRQCSALAFAVKKRSMLASDVGGYIGEAYNKWFGSISGLD